MYVIVTESVVRVNKKYHPQTVSEECKYKVKKRRGKTFFFTHKSSTFLNKKFTVTRYFYIWTYLGSQSKSHYKIVDRAIWMYKVRVDCATFSTRRHLLINKKDKNS